MTMLICSASLALRPHDPRIAGVGAAWSLRRRPAAAACWPSPLFTAFTGALAEPGLKNCKLRPQMFVFVRKRRLLDAAIAQNDDGGFSRSMRLRHHNQKVARTNSPQTCKHFSSKQRSHPGFGPRFLFSGSYSQLRPRLLH